jgi:hypothetical protein
MLYPSELQPPPVDSITPSCTRCAIACGLHCARILASVHLKRKRVPAFFKGDARVAGCCESTKLLVICVGRPAPSYESVRFRPAVE